MKEKYFRIVLALSLYVIARVIADRLTDHGPTYHVHMDWAGLDVKDEMATAFFDAWDGAYPGPGEFTA